MAVQQDWILRVIERLGEALAGWVSGEPISDEVEQALQELVGLSVDRLDAMPAPLLSRMLAARTDRHEERVRAVADVLDALAKNGASNLALSRTQKAASLREFIRG